jgi:hypothetical protein
MKHLIIIGLGLIGLVAFLNYDRIRNQLHPLHSQAAPDGAPRAESGQITMPPLQTNLLATAMPAAPTNEPGTNAPATWQSATAQHYADLIKNIRSTRGN